MPTIPLSNFVKGSGSRAIRVFPFGILYLSAVLKKQRHAGHIACADYAMKNPEKFASKMDEYIVSEAVSAISPHTPDILAFSFSISTSHDFFFHCLPLLKKKWPNATTIVGGMHASNAVQFLLENRDIDYVLAGEGEESFPLLLSSLLRHEKKHDIKGVHSSGAIRYNEKGKPEIAVPIRDLNTLPFPDWNLLDIDSYVGKDAGDAQIFWEGIHSDNAQHRHASLLTTRGCPFKCSFCASHSIHGEKVRTRDVHNVVEEMRQLNNAYGVNHFHVFDDLAIYTTKRTLELLGAMSKSGIENQHVAFTQTLSVACANEDIIDALVAYSGVRTVAFAVESGSQGTQKLIKKNCDLGKAERLIRYAQSKGLIVTINIILGFPGETRERMLESIAYAKDHLKPNWIQFFVATPIIGTEMYDQFIKSGCITNSPEIWNSTLLDHRYFDSAEISADALNELRYLANLECNFADNYDLRSGNYMNALTLFKAVTRLYPFHIYAWDGIRRAEKLSGNVKEVQNAENQIKELVRSDTRSRELLDKYGYFFPEVVEICKDSL